MKNFLNELRWRGFVQSSTGGIEAYLEKTKVTGYVGFDPTSTSLHVGSLLPIMGLVHLQRYGHSPIAIAGGGTGMIGDPSGKTQERKLLSKSDIEANLEGIKIQLSKFLDFKSKLNPALIVDNAEWLTSISFLTFLRDFGKHFSVNEMLAKESIKMRLDQEQGISFTEFSYLLLQSYDFLELFDRYKCTLQMGGSDQWGNIVAGVDLVRRCRGAEVHGIVFPLITTSSGVKFGKTESGTIWLDPYLTSAYKFYQFWYNSNDKDTIQYLKYFTLLEQDRIRGLESSLLEHPEKREAQSALAEDVTRMVHGETATVQAIKASKIFFGGEIVDVTDSELLEIFSDVPSMEVSKDHLDREIPLIQLLVESHITPSKSEARRAIQSGGIYLNNRRVNEIEKKLSIEDSIRGKYLVLRKGLKNYFLVRFIS